VDIYLFIWLLSCATFFDDWRFCGLLLFLLLYLILNV